MSSLIKIESKAKGLPIDEWSGLDLAKKEVLLTACDNGLAEKDEFAFYIYPDCIYKLDSIERKIVELPEEFPFDMHIHKEGNLSKTNIRYIVSLYTYEDGGELIPSKIDGPFIHTPQKDYIFTEEQYNLVQAINEFNELPEDKKGERENYVSFAKIKELSKEAAATLDKYLVSTNVLLPEKIKIDVENECGVAVLKPSIDGVDNETFSNRIDFDEIPDVISIRDNNEGRGRIRIPLSDNQRDGIKKVREVNQLLKEGTEYKNAINYLRESVDLDSIDISEVYSDRVLEIGVYHPRFYTFISPYKSEWIPGIKIENEVGGDTYLFFESKEDVDNFKESTKSVIQSGQDSVEWKGHSIPLDVALESIKSAEVTLKEDKTYASKDSESKKSVVDNYNNSYSECNIDRTVTLPKVSNKVLIIQENAESLGYSEVNDSEMNFKDLSFEPIKNIVQGVELKDHQREGVAWFQNLYNNHQRGCLLADDMGLGKTLQVLYFIQWHKNKHYCDRPSKPYLVVAPISLLENWSIEYDKFFADPKLKVNILLTKDISKKYDKYIVDKMQSMDLILTNYETVRNCQFNLCAVDFAVVVLDEAQKAKTPGTLITQSVKALKAEFKIAATGTPVENTLVDLWCIMDFSIPGLLGSAKDFYSRYQAKAIKGNVDIVGKELRSKLGKFFMRRLKADVAKDLPQKKIIVRKVPMTDLQFQMYKDEIFFVQNIKEKEMLKQGFMFSVINHFRQISDGTYMLGANNNILSANELISRSSKISCTIDILNEIKRRNEKVIIFTDFKETQRVLQHVVYEVFKMLPKIVNGDTPGTVRENSTKESRQKAIDIFQKENGFSVIIMSPIATGMGLNITGANNVIHYSRFWNPAKEEQATDRVYRIGQKKTVNIYYPMAVSDAFVTFDLTIDKLLKNKMSLASATLFPTEQKEVSQAEVFEGLIGQDIEGTICHHNLTVKEVDLIDDYKFEALISALYFKSGYSTILTQNAGDMGIDVLAMGNENLAIQVKHYTNNVGVDAIQEAVSGARYYTLKYGCEYKPAVFTNRNFTFDAINLAKANDVVLLGREKLEKMICETNITYIDVMNAENKRIR